MCLYFKIKFVVDAVCLLAERGWSLLPLYRLHPETGEWHHRNQTVLVGAKWLGNISYRDGRFDAARLITPFDAQRVEVKFPDTILSSYNQLLNNARSVFDKVSCPFNYLNELSGWFKCFSRVSVSIQNHSTLKKYGHDSILSWCVCLLDLGSLLPRSID